MDPSQTSTPMTIRQPRICFGSVGINSSDDPSGKDPSRQDPPSPSSEAHRYTITRTFGSSSVASSKDCIGGKSSVGENDNFELWLLANHQMVTFVFPLCVSCQSFDGCGMSQMCSLLNFSDSFVKNSVLVFSWNSRNKLCCKAMKPGTGEVPGLM